MVWDNRYQWDVPNHWNRTEKNLFLGLTDEEEALLNDGRLKLLYHASVFDLEILPPDREIYRQHLIEYLADEYGIDFDEAFDWEAFKIWYEGNRTR